MEYDINSFISYTNIEQGFNQIRFYISVILWSLTLIRKFDILQTFQSNSVASYNRHA